MSPQPKCSNAEGEIRDWKGHEVTLGTSKFVIDIVLVKIGGTAEVRGRLTDSWSNADSRSVPVPEWPPTLEQCVECIEDVLGVDDDDSKLQSLVGEEL